MNKLISIVSDTHNFLSPDITDILKGSDLIIHAGDIGRQAIIDRLAAVAKVEAVRGNSDGSWAKDYTWYKTINFFGKNIYILHILEDINFDPKEKGIDMVVFGHTHKPKIETVDGVIYLNPGAIVNSKCPTFARVKLTEDNMECEIVPLPV